MGLYFLLRLDFFLPIIFSPSQLLPNLLQSFWLSFFVVLNSNDRLFFTWQGYFWSLMDVLYLYFCFAFHFPEQLGGCISSAFEYLCCLFVDCLHWRHWRYLFRSYHWTKFSGFEDLLIGETRLPLDCFGLNKVRFFILLLMIRAFHYQFSFNEN